MKVYSNKCRHKEKEKSIVNNTNLYLKELGKEEQTKPKISRRKKIANIRVEIECRKAIEKIDEIKFFLREKKDKSFDRLKKKRNTQMNKIRN